MSTISASTTSTTAYKVTADTTGVLTFQTGSSPTTAMTLDTSGVAYIGATSGLGSRLNLVKDTNSTVENLLWLRNSGTGYKGARLTFGEYTTVNGYVTNQYISSGPTWCTDIGATDNVRFFTGSDPGTERARIDSSGRVTTPYQPAFAASISGTPTNTASATVPFGITTLNVGTCFSTGSFIFTAPVAGNYMFTYSIRVDGYTNGNYLHFRPLKNGAVDSGGGGFYGGDTILVVSNGAYNSLSACWIYALAANDTVAISNQGLSLIHI